MVSCHFVSCESLAHWVEQMDLPTENNGVLWCQGGDGVTLDTTEGTSAAHDCNLCASRWREHDLSVLANRTIKNTVIVVNSIKQLLFSGRRWRKIWGSVYGEATNSAQALGRAAQVDSHRKCESIEVSSYGVGWRCGIGPSCIGQLDRVHAAFDVQVVHNSLGWKPNIWWWGWGWKRRWRCITNTNARVDR